MADNDGNTNGLRSTWLYCNARIQRADSMGVHCNRNYRSVYRAYIVWFDEKEHEFFTIVEGENDEPLPRPLETRTSPDGTVFITQENVDLYFCTHLVNIPTAGPTTMRRKISALN